SGIGFQTAAVFVQEGAKVTLADISEEALTKVENFLVKEFPGASVLKVKCDVSSEEQVKSLVGQTVEKFGKLDIIFNNAGIMHPKDDNSQNTPMDIWDKTHDINVKGVFYGCKYAIE
ncbi:NAD(P)-binding protein, partial [Conidiobolus coronatus NRRL 28638]